MAGSLPNRLRAFWVLFSVIFSLAVSFPFLRIFNRDTPVFGIPLLLLYLMAVWLLFIGAIAWLSLRLARRLEKIEQASRAEEKENEP